MLRGVSLYERHRRARPLPPDPGLTDKADIDSETRAAAWGGVTTFFDMPNTKPATTTIHDWEDKMARGEKESHVNYAFFGATNGSADCFNHAGRHTLACIKLFMGASTGNMLVDDKHALDDIFGQCAKLDLPLMTHL